MSVPSRCASAPCAKVQTPWARRIASSQSSGRKSAMQKTGGSSCTRRTWVAGKRERLSWRCCGRGDGGGAAGSGVPLQRRRQQRWGRLSPRRTGMWGWCGSAMPYRESTMASSSTNDGAPFPGTRTRAKATLGGIGNPRRALLEDQTFEQACRAEGCTVKRSTGASARRARGGGQTTSTSTVGLSGGNVLISSTVDIGCTRKMGGRRGRRHDVRDRRFVAKSSSPWAGCTLGHGPGLALSLDLTVGICVVTNVYESSNPCPHPRPGATRQAAAKAPR